MLWVLFMRAVGDAVEHSKNSLVKLEMHRIERQYAMWQVESGGTCPSSLAELDRHTSAAMLRDPWGQPYKFVCGPGAPHGGFGVYSVDPNGVDEHDDPSSDDICTWR